MSETPALPKPLPPSPRRRPWLMVILVAMVFIGGFMSGVGVTVVVAVHRLRYAIHHPEQAPARITAYLDRRLHLTPEQAERIRTLIAERQQRLQAIRRGVQPQVQSELDALRQQIADTLSADQQQRWTAIYDEALRTWFPALPATQP